MTAHSPDVPPVDDDPRSEGYGYGGRIASFRANEFARIDDSGVAYCDHAGAPPHSESLVRESLRMMERTLLGNPHSAHDAGARTRALVDEARDATLTHLNAPVGEYAVVFTSGATGAMRLLAEAFPWSAAGSEFAYTRGNHTSVVGARGCAMAAGAKVSVVDVVAADPESSIRRGESKLLDDDDDERGWRVTRSHEIVPETAGGVHGDRTHARARDEPGAYPSTKGPGPVSHSLFAYSAECNLTGERRPPMVARAFVNGERGTRVGSDEGAKKTRWWTVCDAAKACALAPPDLSADDAPDFVLVSFYKIFGFPAGVGALVARRSALEVLTPRYFGGGVAAGVDACEDFFVRRSGAEGFEDGTLPFTAIAAIPAGFRSLARLAEDPPAHDGDGDWDEKSAPTQDGDSTQNQNRGRRRGSREGAERADAHAFAVAARCVESLLSLKHRDGSPVVVLYGGGWLNTELNTELNTGPSNTGPSNTGPSNAMDTSPGVRVGSPLGVTGQGPTVAFNVLRMDGTHVGYAAVERACAASGVHVRTGCCCNPGACDYFTSLPLAASQADNDDGVLRRGGCGGDAEGGRPGRPRALHAAGKVCGDGVDVDDHNVATGVCRASFGWCSTFGDADALVATIAEHFIFEEERVCSEEERAAASAPVRSTEHASSPAATVASLCVYPLKSAAAFRPPSGSWPLGPNGLLFDREWALASPRGVVLQQRTCPRLVKLAPVIDVDAGVMRVSVLGEPELGRCEVSLSSPECGVSSGGGGSNGVSVRLCGEDAHVFPVGHDDDDDDDKRIDAWFTAAVGAPCSLVRQRAGARRSIARFNAETDDESPTDTPVAPTIGLANSAQILLVSQSSVDHLQGLVDGRRHGRAVEAGGATGGATGGPGPGRDRYDRYDRYDARTNDANESSVAVEFGRFRPNVVVSGDALPPYDEESPAWTSLEIGDAVADGGTTKARLRAVRPCERCSMVGVEQATGARTAEPMLSLSRFRSGSRAAGPGGGHQGVTFGVLFDVDAGEGAGYGVLSVGDVVRAVGCAAAATAA